MNKHISKYLDSYIKRKDTEYSILLNGKWGCGKTYFIKEYQKNNSNYKFIYVSLFGLDSISSINDEIFRELHPILGHKAAKYMGGVITSMIKLGFNLDLFGNKGEETKINIDLNKISPFEKDKDYENIVFVFDDLERTEIEISKILGFINYLCEQSKAKVIVIVNEDMIDESKIDSYNQFKEKCIGKSFEIQNEDRDYWISFKNKNKNNILINDTYIESVKRAYTNYGNNNFRNLNRATEDFIDLANEIEPQYLEKIEFTSMFIEYFFSLSLKFRYKNNIDESIKILREDQKITQYQIFSSELWKKNTIIFI